MDILSDRIRELSLSKTEKRIADYLIVNQDSIGLSTALDLAREIGTSDTSLIRFVHRMGYPSFSVFKREMGSQLVNNSRAMRSSNKYAKARPPRTETLSARSMSAHWRTSARPAQNLTSSASTRLRTF